MEHYGVTGRICATNWTDEDSQVFCKHEGYLSGFSYIHSHKGQYPSESDVSGVPSPPPNAHTHTHTYTARTHTHTQHARTHTEHARTHTHSTHARTHTYTEHARTHTEHARTHAQQARTHAHTYARARTHARTRARAHTHTHTHRCIDVGLLAHEATLWLINFRNTYIPVYNYRSEQ